MKKIVSIFWFRRDLRLYDNRGFFEALKSEFKVLPIFIFDPEILNKLSSKDARVYFIYKQLEELNENLCKWPIGHPDEENFYFCGRKSLKDFSYCKLHLLYAFQPKNKKDDLIDKDSEVPKFIQKKIKSA